MNRENNIISENDNISIETTKSENMFKLDEKFVESYSKKDPDFGFNGLGEMVYLRTYSRIKPNGDKEKWFETVQRVVEWVFDTQKQHVEANTLGWDEVKAQKTAQEMFYRMFTMRFLPPGRGLWIAGTDALKNKPIAAALNNCAFVSTDNMSKEPTKPFEFLMDMSMLGVGVGFDEKGFDEEEINSVIIQAPEINDVVFVIPDDREGWVEALRLTLSAFFEKDKKLPVLDYSEIRPEGSPISGFGGTASGPKPLSDLLESLVLQFNNREGEQVSITDIVDVMNKIGCCVIAGNVRRTAEIAIGRADSDEFLGLKDYHYVADCGDGHSAYQGKSVERAAYGWTSNNSVFANIGMDYSKIANQIAENGEPGLVWLDNMQKYSRMNGIVDNKDRRATGTNPCVEQTLESFELCCLVETFPTRCDDEDDYLRTLKFAYMYAKTVTLCNTHWAETNRVMLRNRRIGTSMSGIAQVYDSKGIGFLKSICEQGYNAIQHWDEVYSDWLCIPRSVKTTSVKPSGSVSLLAGCTPGIHFPENTTYIRRMRLSAYSDMIDPLKKAGYKIEPAMEDETGTVVVEVPVELAGVRRLQDVSMWEQLSIASIMQEYWADNQVSATITFDPETEGRQIEKALNFFQYKLKGISFLPRKDYGAFHQMPYESITKDDYLEIKAKIRPIEWVESKEEAAGERFCSNDGCEYNPSK